MKSSIIRFSVLVLMLGFVAASCGSKEKCPAFVDVNYALDEKA